MADNTRYHSLEEHVKKQEARLQEVLDSMANLQERYQHNRQQKPQEEDGNHHKLEAMVVNLDHRFSGLEQRFNAFMKFVMKEKEGNEDGAENSEPLLPTPPSHLRLSSESEGVGIACDKKNKFLPPNPPKLELPMFSSGNPREWVRKCQKYFLNYHVPESQKVDVVEMFLEGKADIWFQGVKLERPNLSWDVFCELLNERFAEKGGRDVVEEFNKLRQNGSVEEYQEKFEELKSLMLMKNPKLDEQYFVSSFISGLKDEIRPMVKMFKPEKLSKAFDIAVLQEQSMDIQFRHSKNTGKIAIEPKFGMYKSQSGGSNYPTSYRLPYLNPTTKKVDAPAREPKKLSAEEIQHRRAHGLCFKCGEKFGFGHRCGGKQLNFLDGDEEEEILFEDVVGEQDEQTGRPGEPVNVSLNALSGALKRKTIMLIGVIEDLPIKILVDTGSTDSFIHFGLVKFLELPFQKVSPFSVTMANGASVTSEAACLGVTWKIQDFRFKFDLKLMELGSWDIILGVDWMCYFSPITFDFQELNIILSQEGELISLQGFVNQPVMDLVRGKDLREFIQERQKCCATISMEEIPKDNSELQLGIQGVLQQFSQVFDNPQGLPPERNLDHQITLKPDAEPFKLKPYRDS